MELSLNKNTANGSNAMDALSYNYKDGTNQLDHVVDAVGTVEDAADIGSQTAGNYVYNSIGQLTENKSEGVGYVYNTAGLVTQVTKDGTIELSIQYNDRGQRLSKTSSLGTTHYVRDATGSVMGIYHDGDLIEQPIYGQNRLGVRYRDSGKTAYQLSDHLGNVRAVVMQDGDNAVSLTNRADYYPFGMPMPNRQTTDGDYRYAYQGQEKDKETNKEAFELRLWDSRIGRWLTTDPYGEFASPYLGMGNNPISLIDPDGGQTDCPDCPNSGNDPLANAITSGLGITGAPDHTKGGFANTFFNDINYSAIYINSYKGVVIQSNIRRSKFSIGISRQPPSNSTVPKA